MEKIGRSKSTALSLIISGGCCLISAILTSFPSMVVLSTITFLLGKLGVTWTFGNVYVYTSGKNFSKNFKYTAHNGASSTQKVHFG